MTVLEKNLAAIKLTQPDIAENLQHSRMGTAYKGIAAAKTGARMGESAGARSGAETGAGRRGIKDAKFTASF